MGIPVLLDRAQQCRAKLALEPQWESRFEGDSYGFRPGRSPHDALEAIFLSFRQKAKYVLDADIRGCFDNIDQEAFLAKLDTFPVLRRTIKGWLSAGVLVEIAPLIHPMRLRDTRLSKPTLLFFSRA